MAEIADGPQATQSSSRRRLLWLEFVIIALYLVVPTLFAGFFPRSGIENPLYYVYSAAFGVGRIGIVLFIVWTVDGNLDRIGVTKPVWNFDLGLAGLILATYLLICVSEAVVTQGQAGTVFLAQSKLLIPASKAPLFLPLLASVFYAAEREVLTRGYAIGRMQELTKPWIAVTASAIIFSVANLQYGFPFWLHEFVLALLFGLAFLFSRRVWAGFFAHVVLYTLMTIGAYVVAGAGGTR